MQSITLDSNDFPPGQRYRYWQDMRMSAPYPLVETIVPRSGHDDFWARATVRRLGEATVSSFFGGRQRLVRSQETISKVPTGSLMLVALAQGAYEQTFDGHSFFAEPRVGDFAFFNGDMPYTVEVKSDTLARFIVIPREKFRPYLGDTSGMTPRLLHHRSDLRDMLASCFNIYTSMREPAPLAAAKALEVLVHLIALVQGLHPSDGPDLAASLAEARRQKVLHYARSRLEDPRLGAAAIARHLGISLRALYQLFEPTGETIAWRITRLRVERAKEMLLHHPERTALEIGLACGFDSSATFYRNFTHIEGVAPGEFRKSRDRQLFT